MGVNFDFIVGCGFGDEGKGRISAYVANGYNKDDTIACLISGGAQRGHTVLREDNVRHVFHHFGSPTMYDYPTYIHNTFISNPIIFRKEYEELVNKGITPVVFLNKSSICTLPFHMLLNQFEEEYSKILEIETGGSCGLGIYYTTELADFKKDIITLSNKEKFDEIKNECTKFDIFCNILENYGIVYRNTVQDLYDKYKILVENEDVYEKYYEDVLFMLSKCNIVNDISELNKNLNFNNFIFEMSQGTFLSEDFGELYYTPCQCIPRHYFSDLLLNFSHTTVNTNMHFVTRWYQTRHGYDKFYKYYEDANPPPPFDMTDNELIIDNTNVYNQWQGNMNFYPLDIFRVSHAVNYNTRLMLSDINEVHLYITCLDQIKNYVIPTYDDELNVLKNDYIYNVIPKIIDGIRYKVKLYLCGSEYNKDIINVKTSNNIIQIKSLINSDTISDLYNLYHNTNMSYYYNGNYIS